MTCLICQAQGFGIKTASGMICRECLKDIPESLNVKSMSKDALIRISGYERNLKNSGYEVTASYGSLLLDEMSGYVLLADKTDAEGMPVGRYEIYDLSDITAIGLYPIKPRQEKNDIVCDAEFNMEMENPPVKIRKTIKTGARCSYKHIKPTQVEWYEPGELSMFRNMLDHAIESAVNRITKQKLPALTQEDLDMFQAESALLLKDGYTLEEAEDHKERIKKAFRDLSSDYGEVLEFYYDTIRRRT